MSKLLVVIGATGNQGGSVISNFLSDASAKKVYKLRGVTRDASKPAAQKLSSQGVEMVSADLDDKASLVKAFAGANAVFAVTDYWATESMETELQQGKNLADAAKEVGVDHFVLSTLINVTKSTGGKLSKVYHFDSKADSADYARSIGLPMTSFMPGYFMSNAPGQLIRKDDKSGKYVLAAPTESDAQFPLIDIVSDTGKIVKAILQSPDKTIGKEIYAAENYYTPQEMLDGFKKVFPDSGEGASVVKVPDEAFLGALKGMGRSEKVAEEFLENMKLLNKEFGYYNGADLKESHSILTDKLVSWEEFIKNAPAFKDLK